MTNEEFLTKGLVKYILGIFGLSSPFIPNLIGITFDKFEKKKLKIDFGEIETVEFPIYSANTSNSNGNVLSVLAVQISDRNESEELCVVFKCDDLPVFGLKLDLSDDICLFLQSKTKNSWIKPSMAEKLMACAGLDLLNDSGIVWQSCEIDDLLYSSLLDIVEM